MFFFLFFLRKGVRKIDILGIDPGPEKSAYAMIDTDTGKLRTFGFFDAKDHGETVAWIDMSSPNFVIIEQIKNYGMPMSDFVLDTCRVSGALEAFCVLGGVPVVQIPRKTIITALCGLATAKDSNVKSFLLDYFRPHYPDCTGGGREPMTGTRKRPGPFYKFVGNPDLWAATAVAVYGSMHWRDIFESDNGI